MGWFSRSRKRAAEDSLNEETSEESELEQHRGDMPAPDHDSYVYDDDEVEIDPDLTPDINGKGPKDLAEVPELGNRLDMGALRIPLIEGMQMIPVTSPESNLIVGINLIIGTSEMQLMAFAAPRSGGMAQESLDDITEALRSNGGSVDQYSGRWGREAISHVPVTLPSNETTTMSMRIIGIEGNRWLVRAIFRGNSAEDPAAAEVFSPVLEDLVVVRGTEPMPPGDALLLELPAEMEQALAEYNEVAST